LINLEKYRELIHSSLFGFTSIIANSAYGIINQGAKYFINHYREELHMKKIASITVAIGLMASIAATASAAEVTGTASNSTTVTESTYSNSFETIITPSDIRLATPQF